MKTASTTLKNALRQDYTVYVVPKLTAEWNINRYFNTRVYNTPDEDTDGIDIEKFPIESIVNPVRPARRGLNKAVVGTARVSPEFTDSPPDTRWYLADEDSAYEYWKAPYKPTVAPFNTNYINPTVEYVTTPGGTTNVTVRTNKIVVAFETSNVAPDAFQVLVKIGGTWTAVSTNPVIDANGRVTLYFNGTNWTTTRDISTSTLIQGVRVVVTSLTAARYFDLIEISARLEKDLSADLISADDQQNMGEADFITPMGDISSNTGSISLWNGDRTYSVDNSSSPYAGMLDKNVKMWLDFEYNLGGTKELVRQFTMFTETWTEGDDTVSVELVDASRLLQEIKPRQVMYQNISSQEAIWRLCDLVGFTDYAVSTVGEYPYTMLNVFWTDGEQTLWEVFGEVAKATQTAVYFDSYGLLRIKTREAAFNNTRPVDWNVRENAAGSELPDIIDIKSNSDYEANKVVIEVQPTDFKETVDGQDVFDIVWQPDDDVTLRGTPLLWSMNNTQAHFHIDRQLAEFWLYDGVVNIEGEFMKYSGKEVTYIQGGVRKYKWVHSQEEFDKTKASADASTRNQVMLTGAMKVMERGYWNTEVKAHTIDIVNWGNANINNFGGPTGGSGWRHDRQESKVVVTTPGNRSLKDFSYFYSGTKVDEGYRWIGTRMRIMNAGRDKQAGIFFYGDSPIAGGLGAGYYVDITPSSELDGKGRDARNEILLFSQRSDGSQRVFGGEVINMRDAGKDYDDGDPRKVNVGAEAGVYLGVWFELDITVEIRPNGDHRILVDYNGSNAIDTIIPAGSGWQHNRTSLSGFYIRGEGSAEYEYFYGITRPDIPKGEAEPYFDRVNGSWYGQQWERDWMYELKKAKRRVKKKWTKMKIKYSQRFFDEFGPYVHEVREYEVKFGENTDNKPVLQSKVFASNREDYAVFDFRGGPFGARFIAANTARRDVVINGEDALAVSELDGEGIQNLFFVWGRPVVQKESEKITIQNDTAIRARGVIDLTFSSKWLQSKASAENLGKWITSQWSTVSPSLEVTIFGNPLIELTDVVGVQYKEKTTATHQYFVTGIDTGWDDGVTTKLTLRRRTV